jgi:hypothetical protein
MAVGRGHATAAAGSAAVRSIEDTRMPLVLLGLGLLSTSVIVQSTGMVLLIHWLTRIRHVLESPSRFAAWACSCDSSCASLSSI